MNGAARVDEDGFLPPERWACGGDLKCPICLAIDDERRRLRLEVPMSRRNLSRRARRGKS